MTLARALSLLFLHSVFASAAFVLAGAAGAAPEAAARARVVAVERGETLVVRRANGKLQRVFLVGVSAPGRGECYGAEALARARKLALSKSVRLTTDRDPAHSGLFSGTLAAYVTLPDGRDLGRTLIAGGHAIVGQRYPPAPPRSPAPRFARQSAYAAEERGAAAARRGLWRTCSADTSVAIGASPSRAAVGDEVAYTVVVRNVGPKRSGYVSLTVELPQSTGAIDDPPSGCQLGGTTIVCSHDPLGPRVNWSLTIRVRPGAAGSFRATATAYGGRLDPDRSNDTAAVATTVVARG